MKRATTDRETAVELRADGRTLQGILGQCDNPAGVILFAHGSGSSRLSPRNSFVAGKLRTTGFDTLLIDLLAESEEDDRRKVFDIDLLAGRLLAARTWLMKGSRTAGLPIGYFGASTGAAAALQAAAREPSGVGAVVSRGGRPDLAGPWLPRVLAPTLLIVGQLDDHVIELNEMALDGLTCPKKMILVPGATHLFEEPGTLEQAADHAGEWFRRQLAVVDRPVG